MNNILDHGFIPPKEEEVKASEDAGFILGAAGGVIANEINPSANWTEFWPTPEAQSRPNIETYCCAIYSTLNPLETLLRYKYGVVANYAERTIAILSGKPANAGSDPHQIAEIIRTSGVINDSELPFSDDIKTSEQFHSPKPLPQRFLDLGKQWLNAWYFNHEWVFKNGDDIRAKHFMLREALKKGTVAVSVWAWSSEDGIYTKPKGQQDNHWVQLLRFDGEYPVIGDTYFPYEKKLASDYDFGFSKVYYVSENTGNKSIYQSIISIFQKIIAILTQPKIDPPLIPIDQSIPEPVKPIDTPKPMKYEWNTPAKAKHSVRVICDELGLSVADKNLICAVIQCESGFNVNCVHPNQDARKSTDYGICQFNDYWYKTLISPEDALHDPEKAVRLMISQFKKGQLKDWVCYKEGMYKKYL